MDENVGNFIFSQIQNFERKQFTLFNHQYHILRITSTISVGAQSFEHANVLSEESLSLAQMTFTQCTSMSELKFDSVAPPGGQIQQYVSFSALFQSPTKDMAQKYGSTVKNLTLGFSPKLSGGVPIYVWKPGKKFGPKSQC